jgi:hypothetical protein
MGIKPLRLRVERQKLLISDSRPANRYAPWPPYSRVTPGRTAISCAVREDLSIGSPISRQCRVKLAFIREENAAHAVL